MNVLRVSTFKEVIKIKCGPKVGAGGLNPTRVVTLSVKEEEEKRPHEDTERRQLSESQRGRPQDKPTLQTSRPWISSLQNCKKINAQL